MQDDPKNEPQDQNPNTDPPDQPPEGGSGDASGEPQGKTYTESELNAIITSRLSKQERALRKKLQEEQEEERRKAEQSAEERVKELERELQEREQAVKRERANAQRLARLTGIVSNPERVMRLMDDPDTYFGEDGKPNQEAIHTDFPEYVPQQQGPTHRSEPSPEPARGRPTKNPWARDTLNLSEQARILRENPTLADQLRKEASSRK